MVTIGLVGAGAMGAALGAGWLSSGARVVTSAAGRSARTRALMAEHGFDAVEDLDAVVLASSLVVSVVPPGAAPDVARDIAAAAVRTGARPLVLELNAVAPSTVVAAAGALERVGCELVDGSISGGPPRHGQAVRVYLSGARAGDVVPNERMDVVRLDGGVGAASALKMCTASMYKGTKALIMQALLTAEAHGVRAEFLADTARVWPEEVPGWHVDVAVAASKAWRFVDEMHEIARTQADAGLPGALFEGVAAAYARAATTALGHVPPEAVDHDASVSDVLAQLGDPE